MTSFDALMRDIEEEARARGREAVAFLVACRERFRREARREPFCVIDADELEAARRDPAVHEVWRRADEYRQELIARGHCPRCLVVNCEHMVDRG